MQVVLITSFALKQERIINCNHDRNRDDTGHVLCLSEFNFVQLLLRRFCSLCPTIYVVATKSYKLWTNYYGNEDVALFDLNPL